MAGLGSTHDAAGYINEELLGFIAASPTSFQAVDTIADLCAKADGVETVIRNGSSLIAYKVPEGKQGRDIKGFHIVCTHVDSPLFKIKENPETGAVGCHVRLNVEKYGQMIVNTWFDRPLSVAGRVVFCRQGGLIEKHVDLKRPLYVIPSLAVHMTRGTEEKPCSIQKELLPIGDAGLYELLAEEAGCGREDILGTDLYLYNAAEGCIAGKDKSLICAPRLDDLQCVYAALKGFLETQNKEYIAVFAAFDNEEVGSHTRQGAASDFLGSVLKDVAKDLGITGSSYQKLLCDSFLISADNAHAGHPNYPEKADPTNSVQINKGIVIKYHGGQKYTTDAYSGAFVKLICKKSGISYQTYHNHSDIAGGSTLGNIVVGSVPVAAADIGAAQLAMHSCCETAGTADTESLYRFMKEFYRGDGGSF